LQSIFEKERNRAKLLGFFIAQLDERGYIDFARD
jgi:hypothetical protein